MKMNTYKLDRKGFTLVELLAVIVILAVIIAIVVPTVLDSMDDSRVSALHSSAKGVANWWAETTVADSLTNNPTINSTTVSTLSNNKNVWYCLSGGSVSGFTNLFNEAKLNSNDVLSAGTAYAGSGAPTANTCSSITMTSDGSVIVLLVANPSGKFNVAKNGTTYAFSNLEVGQKYPGQ